MVRKALLFSFISNYFSNIIQFIGVMIIARLLTPKEMGVFGIAASIIMFAQALRDFGVSQYIIQEKDLTNDRIRAAFSITIIFGFALFLLVFLLSGVFRNLYNDAGIGRLTRVLSINFLLLPFGAITLSCLRREMNFRARMIVEISSSVVKLVITLLFAILGYSYMSLAYGSLGNAITIILVANLFRPKELPLFPGFKEIHHVMTTSWKIAGISFIITLTNVLPELILGKTLGILAVGFFSRAKATINIFNQVMANSVKMVSLPYFSIENRSGGDIKKIFIQTTEYMTVFAWPFFTFVGVYSQVIIRVLYGNQWDNSAPVASLLCISMVLYFTTALYDQLQVATGGAKHIFKLYCLLLPIAIVLLIACSKFGLKAVAISFSVPPIVRFLYIWPSFKAKFNISIIDFYNAIEKSGVVSAIVLGVGLIHRYLINLKDTDIVMFFLSLSLSILSWLIAIFIVNHPIKYEFRNTVQNIVSRLKFVRN